MKKTMNKIEHLLPDVIKIAIKAGEAILKIYESELKVEYKKDNTPLTLADKTSHSIISDGLKSLNNLHFSNPKKIPILSEEGRDISYERRKKWEFFWCVDPLDGTKEFIKKNGEFTVNIALINKINPVLGVVYAPSIDTIYFGCKGLGSFKAKNAKSALKSMINLEDLINLSEKLSPQPTKQNKKSLTVVVSRSHINSETGNLLKKLKQRFSIKTVSIGSSLKICLVAEGKADLYPRLGPTMEWDTAAGDAIARAVDLPCINLKTKKPLIYNKQELKNPYFLVGNVSLAEL